MRCVAVALCALLSHGASWPASADAARPVTAILLIGRAELPDPDFADSVVLVMNNLGSAPAGIIVNRPTHVAVAELFPKLKRLTQLHDKVYFGGPVEFGSIWFLFRATTPPERAIQAFDGVCLSADRELLLRLLGRAKPMEGLRIFIGHAGWAPGQLEAEINRGAWNLERADSEAIFNGKAEHPWPGSQQPRHGSSPML
jgi:putative transcriptional regulator